MKTNMETKISIKETIEMLREAYAVSVIQYGKDGKSEELVFPDVSSEIDDLSYTWQEFLWLPLEAKGLKFWVKENLEVTFKEGALWLLSTTHQVVCVKILKSL